MFAAYFIIPCHITLKSYPVENIDQPRYSVKSGEGKKVNRITIANLSDFHPSVMEGFKVAIKAGVIYKDISKAFPIKRSLPHGHIAYILELIKKLKFDQLLYRESTQMLHLALGTLLLNEVSPTRDDDRMIHVMYQATEGIKTYWY